LIVSLTIASDSEKGGVLLATVPGINQISHHEMDRWGDFWRFTKGSIQRLFERHFERDFLMIVSEGNVLDAVAFLKGISVEEVDEKKLGTRDPDYQLLITIRAERGR
jgi:hypothetical protein